MPGFDELKNKLRDVVDANADKIDQGLQKAGDLVNERTGGQHADKVATGQGKARDFLDGLDGTRGDDFPTGGARGDDFPAGGTRGDDFPAGGTTAPTVPDATRDAVPDPSPEATLPHHDPDVVPPAAGTPRRASDPSARAPAAPPR